MRGRTWKVESDKADEIRAYLLDSGGKEQEVKSPYEVWRVRFSDSTFTYYTTGKLYSTPSKSRDPAVFNAWGHIDSIAGPKYIPPTKDYLIGLDETGKGEVIGHTVLTGVIFPKEIFSVINDKVGSADTKKRHSFEYWDEIFRELDSLTPLGFDFIFEKVPPWHVDRYNLNKIMDVVYQRILSSFFRRVEISRCRIVLDDYGVGDTLSRFLDFLEKQGAEVIVTNNSEEFYLEARVASLISKRIREGVIKKINENPNFQIDGISVGSGNAGNPRTVEWLKRWHASGREWPWFVKKSFKTIREIEEMSTDPKKEIPPIREELMSREFMEELDKGRLSITSLSIVCPNCGEILKGVTFAITGRDSTIKCPECNEFIRDAGMTLRYYCGYLIPDSSIIQRGLISKDLEKSRVFEGFTIVLVPVVRKECDKTKRGKEEFDKLAHFGEIGRIRLEAHGSVRDVPNSLSNVERDEIIVDSAIELNGILLTADKGMRAYAIGRDVFTIFI
jgi:ribonuclease HII